MNNEFEILDWNDTKTKLKQKFPLLTNSDLIWRHGTKEELLSMISHKLGKTNSELQKIINSI
jgi:hypothetical protein